MKSKKSFEDWCKETNHENYLMFWSEANDCKPSEVSFRSTKKIAFKCQRNLHKDRLIEPDRLVNKNIRYLCKECNSIAQWGIDTYGNDFLEKY